MTSTSKRIMENPPRILIATPGRLVDHLENTPSFAHLFNDLKVIVYDEADRLLDQGFRRELDKILGYLPDKTKVKRQALLFSATVSEEIKVVAKGALASNYKFISTLREDEINTHEHGMPFLPTQCLV
jgi:ATP-dependent RNA helicase MSS116